MDNYQLLYNEKMRQQKEEFSRRLVLVFVLLFMLVGVGEISEFLRGRANLFPVVYAQDEALQGIGEVGDGGGEGGTGQEVFGGPIIFMLPCEEPPGFWIIVGPPVPKSLILHPGSLIYAYGAVVYGEYLLGDALKEEMECAWYVPYRIVVGEGLPIIKTGTSL